MHSTNHLFGDEKALMNLFLQKKVLPIRDVTRLFSRVSVAFCMRCKGRTHSSADLECSEYFALECVYSLSVNAWLIKLLLLLSKEKTSWTSYWQRPQLPIRECCPRGKSWARLPPESILAWTSSFDPV